MVRMLLIGYCFSIRSERRLCQEVKVNLAYRWFCGLGLEDTVPHHSTFSVNRHGRFRDSDILRKVFEEVVCSCMKAGLVGGEGFAIDASVIEADASRFQRVKGSEVNWTDKQRATRPVQEYLLALESENPPINPDQKPKAMSPSDPASAWTTRGRYKVMFGYSLNYVIDMESPVILDVEATPTRLSLETDATEIMVERIEDRLGLKPKRFAGDTAYGNGKTLGWLVERDIEPHIPVWDRGKRSGAFAQSEFTYDAERDIYLCPTNKPLTTTRRVHPSNTIYYRASTLDCGGCQFKEKCCPKSPERRVSRNLNETAREHARALMQTEAYVESSVERKKIEVLFGEAKHILSMDRLRLRGLSGARDEFLLTATVQNLKRLVAHVTIPPPEPISA